MSHRNPRNKRIRLVGVRMPDDLLKKLEKWIARQPPERHLSRPEAIRRLLEKALTPRDGE